MAGALSALAVLTLGAHQHGQAATWRPLVLATSDDALGHLRPGAPRSDVAA